LVALRYKDAAQRWLESGVGKSSDLTGVVYDSHCYFISGVDCDPIAFNLTAYRIRGNGILYLSPYSPAAYLRRNLNA